jgi:hypothetical protein
MSEGFFLIYHKLCESDIWLMKPLSKGQAWIDLIHLAQFHDSSFFIRGIRVEVKRGQLAWSEAKLTERWGWSRNKLRNYLKYLKKVQQIVQQKSNVIQIITIVNYDKYQVKGTTNDTTKGTTEGTHTKEGKEDKEDNIYSSDFENFFNEYHRITGKQKTDKASSLKKWKQLNKIEQARALEMIQAFYDSVNDKNYIKKARTYLNDKNFNDEFKQYKRDRSVPAGRCLEGHGGNENSPSL